MGARAKVSVIIPCFNHGKYIDDAVDSVLKSDYDNIEIIVVNDGSTDAETIAVLEKYNKPYTRIISIPNQGLSKARNIGIENSTGKYILPLDSDDMISSKYISESVEILEQNINIKIVYSNAKYFGEIDEDWILPKFNLDLFLVENQIFCSGIYRRSDYDNTCGYNSNMIYGAEDWDFWLSMIENGGDVHKIGDFHFYCRVRNGSMVRSISAEQAKYLRRQIFLNHVDLYASKFQDPVNLYYDNFYLNKKADFWKSEFDKVINSDEFKFGGKWLARINKILRKK